MSTTQFSSDIVVLLVGDYEPVKSLLRKEGLCVLTAATGEEALDLSQRFTDELALITDIDIGQMTATELCSRILKQRPKTRVLFIANVTQDLRGLPCGAHVLERPFSLLEFFDKLRAMLPTSDPLQN